jgi:hypothetical protein
VALLALLATVVVGSVLMKRAKEKEQSDIPKAGKPVDATQSENPAVRWPPFHHKKLFRLHLKPTKRRESKMATTLTLTVGKTDLCDLTGTDQYGNPITIPATPAPTYASDTPAVATVSPSPDGNPLKVLVTAVAVGTANISATDLASTNPISNAVICSVIAPPAPVLTNLVLAPE